MATLDLGKIKQVWRGTYNNSTAYTVDDLVAYTDTVGGLQNTSTYICVTNSTGNAPASAGTVHGSWNLVAQGVPDRVPSQSGNSGKVLKTDGSALSWGVGGGVVQTQQHVLAPPSQVASTSDTWIATGLTKVITPTSASNKIFASACLVYWIDSLGTSISGGKGIEAQLRITRTVGGTTTSLGEMEYADWHGLSKWIAPIDAWDTTYNSTAAITYAVEFRRRTIYSGNNPAYVHRDTSHTTLATLSLTEYAV